MQDTTQPITPAEIKRYQCRHIFTDGRRCGSPCLRHEEFCYYHHTTRRPIENPRERRNRQAQFDLPLPEDRTAIQLSIGEVLRRIARNEIDSKRAGLLLYGLQIASLNLPRATAPSTTTPVEEIVADPQLGTLAPKAEVPKEEKPKTYLGTLLELLKEDPEEEPRHEPEVPFEIELAEPATTPLDQPTILPEIQATEEDPTAHTRTQHCNSRTTPSRLNKARRGGRARLNAPDSKSVSGDLALCRIKTQDCEVPFIHRDFGNTANCMVSQQPAPIALLNGHLNGPQSEPTPFQCHVFPPLWNTHMLNSEICGIRSMSGS